jgi:hypothetical protein
VRDAVRRSGLLLAVNAEIGELQQTLREHGHEKECDREDLYGSPSADAISDRASDENGESIERQHPSDETIEQVDLSLRANLIGRRQPGFLHGVAAHVVGLFGERASEHRPVVDEPFAARPVDELAV